MKQWSFIWIPVSGLLGTIALTLYFSAPFHWMPLPPPRSGTAEIMAFGKNYHTAILADTFLQQMGTLLSVIFILALVHRAGRAHTLAGRLTLLAATVITSLSLAEGSFALAAVQAGDNGHPESALTCFELTNVFIHIFLLAPSLFLMMGLALKGTDILPAFFIGTAIALGILFQLLGIIALFYTQLLLAVIAVLMLQNLWTIAASITLLTKTGWHKRPGMTTIK